MGLISSCKMDNGAYIAAAGMTTANKPSTKVMAPPGGRTNNIFANDDGAPTVHTVNEGQKRRNASSVFDIPTPTPNNNTNNNTKKANNNSKNNSNSNNSDIQKKANLGASVSENITGPRGVNGVVAPGGGRSSTKVMAPPGGKTSILFG